MKQPHSYDGPYGPIRINANDPRKTVASGPRIPESAIRYGASTPGPFGEVRGWVGKARLAVTIAPWGTETGRHALAATLGEKDYLIRSPGRLPQPTIERADGTVVARMHPLLRFVSDDISAAEVALLALILGSGLHELTLPQSWFART